MIEVTEEELEVINRSPLQLTDEEQEFKIEDYIDMEVLDSLKFKVSEPFASNYQGLDDIVVRNIELNTTLKKELIETGENEETAWELEDYRMFPRNFLQRKGVFFCENIAWLTGRYSYMVQSDIFQITNGTYTGRYMLPICLPNGDVFTHMGYCPPTVDREIGERKYEMGSVEGWINQGNLVGNLESLSTYPDKKIIYIAEGMMDAYRLECVYESPALAILGSRLTPAKRAILQYLKDDGYTLIYIPDEDKSGLNNFLLKEPLIDNIYRIKIPSYLKGSVETCKDFDILVKEIYIKYIQEHAAEISSDLEPDCIPVALLNEDCLQELNEIAKSTMSPRSAKIYGASSSANAINDLLASFGLVLNP